MNTPNKEQALEEIAAIKERINTLQKIVEDAGKPKTVLTATNAEEALAAAINYLGESDEEVKIYRHMEQAGIVTHYLSEQRCVIVCKALNEKKSLNSTTYTPWFDKTKKPGAGFFLSCYAWFLGRGDAVSFRLHLNERDHAIHVGKIMGKEYYTYLMK